MLIGIIIRRNAPVPGYSDWGRELVMLFFAHEFPLLRRLRENPITSRLT